MKIFIALIILIFFGIEAGAAEELERLSLEKALKIAFENSPEMVTARKNIESARARVTQALVYPNPEFEALIKDSGDGEIGFSQELDLFGKRTLRGELAKNEIKIYESDFDLIWTEVSLEIKEAYANILLASKTKELAEETLNLTRKLLDKVREKFNFGEALKNELLRAEIESLSAQNDLLLAEREISVNKAKLNILLGREPSFKFVCIDEFVYRKKNFALDNLIQKALINRPDLKAKKLSLDAKNMGVRLAKKEVLANPSIGLLGERGDGEEKLGVTLRIPLPFWDRRQGEIAEARTELEIIEHQINSLQRQIELEVSDAFEEVILADKRVALWEKALENANVLVKTIGWQYEEGKITFLTYLETLKKFKETKWNYLKALADHQMKLAILEKTIGGEL